MNFVHPKVGVRKGWYYGKEVALALKMGYKIQILET